MQATNNNSLELLKPWLSDVLAPQPPISPEEMKVREERLHSLPRGLVDGILRAYKAAERGRQEFLEANPEEKVHLNTLLAAMLESFGGHLRAIKRFILGTWIVCEGCGRNIELERLRQNLTTCLVCAQAKVVGNSRAGLLPVAVGRRKKTYRR